jgi:RNA polymerase sigma-70 factor (ECF subfamily)
MNAINPESKADQFLQWLEPIKRDLEVYCRRMLWNPQEVPDALHNALIRAIAAFDRCWDASKFRAWMFKILTHEILTLNRKHARIARFEFQLEPEELETLSANESNPSNESSLEDGHWEQGLDDRLDRALKTLTEPERAVLLLRAIGNFKYVEISEELNLPVGSVMGYLARARGKMQRALQRSRLGKP